MSSASAQNQRIHFWLLRVQIYILLGIAAVSAIDWQLFPVFRTVSIIVAVSLIGVSLVQMFGQIQKYDSKWFASRAVAESVKTQTWRFMMRVSPYRDGEDASGVVAHFVADVRQLLKEQQDAKLVAGSQSVEGTEVTKIMLDGRNRSVSERREFYLRDRIRDQKDWYSKKAVSSSRLHDRWLVATFASQGGAGVIALLTVLFPGFALNPVGIVTTLASCGMSWMNAKSYRELSQSYGLIAHDLSGYESEAEGVDSQEKLEKLVSNVEGRISGEHTYWKARRMY